MKDKETNQVGTPFEITNDRMIGLATEKAQTYRQFIIDKTTKTSAYYDAVQLAFTLTKLAEAMVRIDELEYKLNELTNEK